VGGIAIITVIVVVVILRRRKQRAADDAASTVFSAPTSNMQYASVPTGEFYDPYASSGYGHQAYPNPSAPGPSGGWAQTNQGPFGSGSLYNPPPESNAPWHR
jgi:hypothetical protein